MITLNKLTRRLLDEMLLRGDINGQTSPRAMSIAISRDWRRFDACPVTRPPLHLAPGFVVPLHQSDACPTWQREFGEREERGADIIIDTALAMEHLGCKNVEQAVKDRIAWRLAHTGETL